MQLRKELSRLQTCNVSHEKAVALQARLLRHAGEWLVVPDDPRVPPTNNLAERDLRPLVVLRKITFGNRSDDGAKRTAALMTVVPTVFPIFDEHRRDHFQADEFNRTKKSPDGLNCYFDFLPFGTALGGRLSSPVA